MIDPHTRARIVAEAKTWLGTPYHPAARVKGAGCDCALFPAAVYEACGVIEPVTDHDYPPDWHLHSTQERYLSAVLARAQRTHDPLPGDFVLYRWGKLFAHGGIVVEWPKIIHSVIGTGVTYAEGGGGELSADRRTRMFFTQKGA